jgi:hypothetical protein
LFAFTSVYTQARIGVILPKLISEITKEAGGKFVGRQAGRNFLNLFTFSSKCLKYAKRQRLRDSEFSNFVI